MELSSAVALLVSAVTVAPQAVPAHGRQEALITIDRPAMVHFQTSGPTAPRCEIVDHLRGPFDTSGVVGKTHCQRDLLLDSGNYKVRLTAPSKGKGTIALKVAPFTEVNSPTPQLEPGRVVEQTLSPEQQASFWIRIDKRQLVTLRLAGRTVGAVELWRDGQWRTEVGAQSTTVSPSPGQPIYEWWVRSQLEPGDYLVTAYGASPQRWSQGTESDALTVAYGFPPAPDERSASVNIPASGFVAYQLPPGEAAAALSLPAAIATPTSLSLLSDDELTQSALLSPSPGCQIEPRTLTPQCATYGGGRDKAHVLIVRGAPGTHVDLQWTQSSGDNQDGQRFGETFAVPHDGKYLTGTYELFPDQDAAPLSCVLEEDRDRSGQWVALTQDFLQVGSKQPFQRSFNFASSQTMWFQVNDTASYRIASGGDFPTSCELFRIQPSPSDASGLERMSQTPSSPARCNLSMTLERGLYELHLYGEKQGIQTLRIATSHAPTGDTPTKASCVLPPVTLARGSSYRIRVNARSEQVTRLLMLRPAPLTLAESFPLFLEPNRPLQLPIAPGGPLEVRGRGNFTCALGNGAATASKDGVCRLAGTTSTTTLTLSTKEPVNVGLVRQKPPPAKPPPLASYSVKPIAIPKLLVDKPQFYDFGREESRSLLFEVQEPGLYHVETHGLLDTKCELRTAVVTNLASDHAGGRGRNCLLEQYLRPGRYLVTVTTVGASRGRASVALTRRAPREATPVTADAETFFAVGDGELIQERLTIPPRKRKRGRAPQYHLSTTARGGASVSCRLEDKDGWPLIPVPTSCDLTRSFDPGDYLWMQLPLTVESVRHTKLARVQPPIVFTGKKVHAVVFNQWTDAILRPDGHDEYFINLQADTDLTIALTNRMQGRLYFINPDKSLKPVEVIPPSDANPNAPAVAPTPEEETEEAAPSESESSAGEAAPEETTPEDATAEEQPSADEASPVEAPAPAAPRKRHHATTNPVPPLPPGTRVHLTAGPYKLITEHSQGDVHIRYRLFVGSEVLAPGVSRELPVPSSVTLRMPQNGTLRLKTSGETDVRCRLFDKTGRLVTESSHNGDDWNCALAEPMTSGDYTLVLEDEAQRAGSTTVSIEMPDVQDVGALASGSTLQVGKSVITGVIPPVQPDAVQELDLASPTAFSCAIEDPSGAILKQQLSVTTCGFLLHPGPGSYRARVWTLDQPTNVSVTLAARPIQERDDGRAKQDTIARTRVKAAGRYMLDAKALCLPEASHGLLQSCGPEASLEAGPLLIGALGGAALEKKLTEITLAVESPTTEQGLLSRRPAIQRQHVGALAVHLLQVTTPPGERAAPACSIEGGLRALLPSSCVAVSRISKEALAYWWAPADVPIEAEVVRAAAVLPSKTTPLALGKRTLEWSGATARYALPSQPVRLDLTLPDKAWAVRLEPDGSAGDLCVAQAGFERCVMSGSGGELVLYSPDEQRADATLVLEDSVQRPEALGNLFEDLRAGPGSLRLNIAARAAWRALDVQGAVHCLTTLADGTRIGGCTALIPFNVGAQFTVEHDAGAIRVSLGPPDQPLLARFGQPIPGASTGWIPWSKGVPLTGGLVDRSFTTDQEAVVHVRADSGVCALVSGNTVLATEGFGGACELHRLLKPGTYRVLVRPFGRVPLSGSVSWTTEPVTQLSEGVGPETWIAPTEARLFTFTTQSAGKIGFGVQVPAETLDCTVMDAAQRVLGTGCQQYLQLDAGSYVLSVRAPAGSPPTRFKPVLLGLAGATREVPEEYLRDFFQRIGAEQ